MGKKVRKISDELKWEDSLRIFLAEKKAQGRSETTLLDYDYHIKQFYHQYPSGDLKTNLYEYMSQKIAPATYNIRLAYLKSFFKWSVENGYLTENPLQSLKRPISLRDSYILLYEKLAELNFRQLCLSMANLVRKT